MPHILRSSRALLWFPLVLLLACTAAPVQEMSDARQAIVAAEQAGAGERAPAELAQAKALLDSAEDKLERKFFTGARRDAEAARERALRALRLAREAETRSRD